MPDPRLLDPVSLLLTDKYSDAAKPWDRRPCLRFEAGAGLGAL